MKLEVWSDVACPWCYVGKRRLEEALSRFEHRDAVDVVWRSFELDPQGLATQAGSYVDRLASKYRISEAQAQAMIDRMVDVGRQHSIAFDFESAKPANTFDAHRLLHLALSQGVQDALGELLFAARFTQGLPVDDLGVLTNLAIEAGLDGDEARAVLGRDTFSEEVRADEHRATALGISSVPFFVIDGRYGLAGAHPANTILRALEEAWSSSEAEPGTATASRVTG